MSHSEFLLKIKFRKSNYIILKMESLRPFCLIKKDQKIKTLYNFGQF